MKTLSPQRYCTILAFFAALTLFGSCTPKETKHIQYLCEGWTLSSDTLDRSITVDLPSVVQTELYEAGLIPHPYSDTVEKQLLWISDTPWQYSLHFDLDEQITCHEKVELIFEGIDTHADVFLNGEKILEADNMFRTWTLDVKDMLQERDNSLTVKFPAYDSLLAARNAALTTKYPEPYALSRKAAYQHGWDWAPKYKNIGIWKPAYIKAWSDAIINYTHITTRSVTDEEASMQLTVDVNSLVGHPITAVLSHNQKEILCHNIDGNQQRRYEIPFTIEDPLLWMPNNDGEQHRYVFELELRDGSQVIDRRTIKTGIRTVELVQEPDSIGTSFGFKINGSPVYAFGANYVPEDNFTTWMSYERTLKLLVDAKEANFNMLRIWGGGTYPPHYFFDICDSLGIMVWQDFMFIGTTYPSDSIFLANVRREAEEQVNRYASHPSLVLWCGNNEISEGYYNWGWQKSCGWSEEEDKAMKRGYDMLFEELLDEVVAKNDGSIPYWPSSPSKGWGRKESLIMGDVHYWGVWWGEEPYEMYEEKVGRFNSEFGYQSYPDITTLSQLDTTYELTVGCDLIEAHQKHPRGTRLVDDHIKKYFPYSSAMQHYVYLSQLSQAYGMLIAIESHRRSFPRSNGSLYWQINDPWPVVSWSSIDYNGNKKALHYQLKSLYAPIHVGMKHHNNDNTYYVNNETNTIVEGTLSITTRDMKGNELQKRLVPIIVEPNNIWRETDNDNVNTSHNDRYTMLELIVDDEVIAEKYYYYDIPKNLKLLPLNLTINKHIEQGEIILEICADVLAKNVYLYAKNVAGSFSDNYFDLEAGKTKTIRFTPDNKEVDLENITIDKLTLNDIINE